MQVFLDANVLFSAAYSDENRPRFFFELQSLGHLTLQTCEQAVEEARRNLAAKKPARVPALESLLLRVGVVGTVLEGRLDVEINDTDRPILLSALACGATHLVTGNTRDFQHLFGKSFASGLRVVTPTQFFQSLGL
jgi:predicted nucleic acid-binding protein